MQMSIQGRIPIHIHPIFWLLVLLIAGINSNFTFAGMLVWVVVIVVSALVHEFGHALTAIAFGQKAHIDLVAFGGLTHRHGPHLKLSQEFLIVLNGPLAGLALAVACYFIAGIIGEHAPLLSAIFEIGFLANIYWTVINLLPIQPLDGGHLLRITLEGMFGLRGIKIALFISFLTSLLLCLLLLINPKYFLLGIFFSMFAFENYRAWQSSLGVTERDKDSTVLLLMKSAEKDYQKGNEAAALQKLEHLVQLTKKGIIFLNATQMIAKILDHQGRARDAYQHLLPLKSQLPPESLALLHKLAYRLGELQEAISLGAMAYQRQPSYEAALINAFSYALQGNAKPAVGWLQCAVKEGLPNLHEVIQEMEFNNIRNDPAFRSFVERGAV